MDERKVMKKLKIILTAAILGLGVTVIVLRGMVIWVACMMYILWGR